MRTKAHFHAEFWSRIAISMSKYRSIDPILSEWAEAHSLAWLTDYQGGDVRTFFLKPNAKERVQVWVDPPQGDDVKVHVFQSKMGLYPKKLEEFSGVVSELPETLDKALGVAQEWLVLRGPGEGGKKR